MGIEIQLLGPLSSNGNIALNYIKSSSSKQWYSGEGPLAGQWSGDNNFIPSSSQSSYPFEEVFVEFNGYNSSGSIFYKTGLDLAQGTGVQKLTVDADNDNDSGQSGYLYLFNPSSTTFVKHFIACGNLHTASNESENDFVAITNVGAYGSSLSSNYNTRPLIAEILVNKNDQSLSTKKT